MDWEFGIPDEQFCLAFHNKNSLNKFSEIQRKQIVTIYYNIQFDIALKIITCFCIVYFCDPCNSFGDEWNTAVGYVF